MQNSGLHAAEPIILVLCCARISASDLVETSPLPAGAMQPRVAVSVDGTGHTAWLTGTPEASEVWYATRTSGTDD